MQIDEFCGFSAQVVMKFGISTCSFSSFQSSSSEVEIRFVFQLISRRSEASNYKTLGLSCSGQTGEKSSFARSYLLQAFERNRANSKPHREAEWRRLRNLGRKVAQLNQPNSSARLARLMQNEIQKSVTNLEFETRICT